MTNPRLKSISIRGFRSYGATEQTLKMTSDIVAVWGPNSKGKTSLAEAFEFLLTGSISRRQLMASSKDEFAGALRNAHLAPAEAAYVAARILAKDGKEHEIRRVLISDYEKRGDCTSRLEIDGAGAFQDDLAKLGIWLSQPPLEAPVLAQHTLGYIFSVRPQDRATYFKTLLDVTDLDDLRDDVAALEDELKLPDDPRLVKFDKCAAIPALEPSLASASQNFPDASRFREVLEDAAGTLIGLADETVPTTFENCLTRIDEILVQRRSKRFPVSEFAFQELGNWSPPAASVWTQLEDYLRKQKSVDEETSQLIEFFDEALKIPSVSSLSNPADCPLCCTKSALTPLRVHRIRQYLEDYKAFKAAKTVTESALSRLSMSVQAVVQAAEGALPHFLKIRPAERRATGFRVPSIRAMVGVRSAELVNSWVESLKAVVRAWRSLRLGALAAVGLIEQQRTNMARSLDTNRLRAAFGELAALRATFGSVLDAYEQPAMALATALNGVLDEQSDTVGWQDFLDVARKPDNLREILKERAAHAAVQKELATALREIDRAKEKVLDDKFSDFSGLIQAWWERLRPDEATFFSAVQPRKGAKRTIDFKAGLSAEPDRSAPKVRDVIAVFSQSQLHCLGLAMFLARAQHERLGFIILDDPVLSSDEDYRVHFNSTVLADLVKIPMQIIVLTQDHDTWEELETRYRHLGISSAQLYVETQVEGTIIENTSDLLRAKINRAKSLARGGHPDVRKECGIHLRDAGERFCKEMLVNEKRSGGNTVASLTDYDGKTLEWLCPRVDPLLDHDPSHPGKLAAFKATVNKACHDNTPPANAEMTQACGEIHFLVKDYLGR